MKRAGITLLLLVVSCTRSASNHEELGDRAYAAGAYVDALAEYELARKANASSAGLLAKVGASAMHAEDYELAAGAYRTLAQRDRSRADERSEERRVGKEWRSKRGAEQ